MKMPVKTLLASSALLVNASLASAACDERLPQFKSADWETSLQVLPSKEGRLSIYTCEGLQIGQRSYLLRLASGKMPGVSTVKSGNDLRYVFIDKENITDLGSVKDGFCAGGNANRCEIKFTEVQADDAKSQSTWTFKLHIAGQDQEVVTTSMRPDFDSPALLLQKPAK